MTVIPFRQPTEAVPNDLSAFWMPFTANRAFKERPRMVSRAKDMHYFTPEGRPILDASAGLWCTNAGHNREPIVEAIRAQAKEMDYSPNFQYGNPMAFEAASRIADLAPKNLDHVFFCNSGSEAVDTAMKIALAYWNAKGEGQRTRFIGREKGYHGAGFGGISVGGMVNNRKMFGNMLNGIDHLPQTYHRDHQAFTMGEPEWGAHLADELERLVALHDARNIAAVIVEPMAGSIGVFPPPKGYLERLRALCTKHNILLIFDEVITGFGRLGYAFASERYGVTPDMITFAKGVTSAAVPMGGVIAHKEIHDAFMQGPKHLIEFFHGYTYSAHPLACAAAIATLNLYRDEELFERAKKLEKRFGETMMELRSERGVLDIRTLGLTAAFDMVSHKDGVGIHGYKALEVGFHDFDMMFRAGGDTLAISPPLIVKEHQIDEIADKLRKTIRAAIA